MTIQHHISDALLMDYASGVLEESWSIAVATHLALCPVCRKRLELMEEAGGALLDTLEHQPLEMDENDAWKDLKARLALELPTPSGTTSSKAEKSLQKMHVQAGQLPEPLRSYVGELDALKWRSLGLGAYHLPITTADKDISVRLLRIPAGRPVPEHGHGGRELTLVLKGSFKDASERFGPGDFEEMDETINHQPVAEPGEDCICLAITDAPLKFRSRIVRAIQPFLGI